eukprot:2154840-Amphidinium_carterae.1
MVLVVWFVCNIFWGSFQPLQCDCNKQHGQAIVAYRVISNAQNMSALDSPPLVAARVKSMMDESAHTTGSCELQTVCPTNK